MTALATPLPASMSTGTMRATVFHAPGDIRVEEVAASAPRDPARP